MLDRPDSSEPEPPPLLGSWGRVYAFVLGVTLLVYLLLVLFSLAAR